MKSEDNHYKSFRNGVGSNTEFSKQLAVVLRALRKQLKHLSSRERDEISRVASDIIQLVQGLKPSGIGRGGREIRKLLAQHARFTASWLDHIAINGEEFISEPYNIGLRNIEELVAFCRENGLDVTVTGRSYHFPGETFRVILTKRKDEGRVDAP